jgi:hypothetical protein
VLLVSCGVGEGGWMSGVCGKGNGNGSGGSGGVEHVLSFPLIFLLEKTQIILT